MQSSLPVYVIIVAGGQGTRMGNAVPKQFLELNGKPILFYTIQTFYNAVPDAHIILVLPQQHLSYVQMVLQHLQERIDITLVSGGESRFHSVKNGLNLVSNDAIVLVHDGVRPLVSKDLIKRCILQANQKGSAIPSIPVTDSIRMVHEDTSKPIDRNLLRIIQTPQTFKSSILLPAFQQEYSTSFTDEATVVEAYGEQVFLVDGERNNIKITTPEDMVIAEAILKTVH